MTIVIGPGNTGTPNSRYHATAQTYRVFINIPYVDKLTVCSQRLFRGGHFFKNTVDLAQLKVIDFTLVNDLLL